MRRAVALAVAFLLALVPAASAQDRANPRDPGMLNKLVRVIESPQLAPGEAGVFRLNLSNPYTYRMSNISLNASIYQYATIDETRLLDGTWTWQFPRIRESGWRDFEILRGLPSNFTSPNPPNNYMILQFTIETSWEMPHGSVFTQSAYFLRFWLEFDFDNGTSSGRYVMASKGYFSDQAWLESRTNWNPALRWCNEYNATNRCVGLFNLTRLGVDGLIPDSSFGVKEPIPTWPFYGLVVATGLFLVLAFLFWTEENPGRYPRIERRWLALKGRLRRTIRLPARRSP